MTTGPSSDFICGDSCSLIFATATTPEKWVVGSFATINPETGGVDGRSLPVWMCALAVQYTCVYSMQPLLAVSVCFSTSCGWCLYRRGDKTRRASFHNPDGDRISAGNGDNVIAGGAGPDIITTGEGRDLICSDFCEFKTDGTVGVPKTLASLAPSIGGMYVFRCIAAGLGSSAFRGFALEILQPGKQH